MASRAQGATKDSPKTPEEHLKSSNTHLSTDHTKHSSGHNSNQSKTGANSRDQKLDSKSRERIPTVSSYQSYGVKKQEELSKYANIRKSNLYSAFGDNSFGFQTKEKSSVEKDTSQFDSVDPKASKYEIRPNSHSVNAVKKSSFISDNEKSVFEDRDSKIPKVMKPREKYNIFKTSYYHKYLRQAGQDTSFQSPANPEPALRSSSMNKGTVVNSSFETSKLGKTDYRPSNKGSSIAQPSTPSNQDFRGIGSNLVGSQVVKKLKKTSSTGCGINPEEIIKTGGVYQNKFLYNAIMNNSKSRSKLSNYKLYGAGD
jgi:hypothetical protein